MEALHADATAFDGKGAAAACATTNESELSVELPHAAQSLKEILPVLIIVVICLVTGFGWTFVRTVLRTVMEAKMRAELVAKYT